MAIKIEIGTKISTKVHIGDRILLSSTTELSRKIKEEALINPFLIIEQQAEEGITESDLNDEPSSPLDDELEASDEIFSDEEIEEEPAEEFYYKEALDGHDTIELLERRLSEEELDEILTLIADKQANAADTLQCLNETLGTEDTTDEEPALSIRYSGDDQGVQLSDIPDITRISVDKDLKENLAEQGTISAEMTKDYNRAVSLALSVKWSQDNLLEVGKIIAQRQNGFFKAPDMKSAFRALNSLTQVDVARSIGVKGIHKATLNKLIKNKFVDTKFGLVPMKLFFHARPKAPGNLTPKDKCLLIMEYLESRRNATDREIMEYLNGKGVSVSEKMVGYYRKTWLGVKRDRGRKTK